MYVLKRKLNVLTRKLNVCIDDKAKCIDEKAVCIDEKAKWYVLTRKLKTINELKRLINLKELSSLIISYTETHKIWNTFLFWAFFCSIRVFCFEECRQNLTSHTRPIHNGTKASNTTTASILLSMSIFCSFNVQINSWSHSKYIPWRHFII